MYRDNNHEMFLDNTFNGVYKDKIDLVNMGVDFKGVIYDDEWTVKKFLNGYKFKVDDCIYDIFNELSINISLLKRRIKTLSKGQFKLILLCYVLLNNKKFIILDYFDKGLSHINKKRVINYLKRKYKGTLVVISNDLIFLNSLCSNIIIFKDKEIVFNDSFQKLYKSKIKLEYPEIINFIRLANKSKAKLGYTVSTHELLKDIYRSVK